MKKNSDHSPEEVKKIQQFVRARTAVNDKLSNIHEMAASYGLRLKGKGQLVSSIYGPDHVQEADGQILTRYIDIADDRDTSHRISLVLAASPDWKLVVRLESDVSGEIIQEIRPTDTEAHIEAEVKKIETHLLGYLREFKMGG